MKQVTRIVCGLLWVMALACGSSGNRENAGSDGIITTAGQPTSGTTGTTSSGGGGGDTNPRFDVNVGDAAATSGGDNTGCTEMPVPDATVVGTVFAPNLEVPISGALVYLRNGPPDPIPDGVYCAECVQIPCGKFSVLTNPDGTFELPANAGLQTLVVTKGQFMHAVEIDVVVGTNMVAPEDSNLPEVWDPAASKWIPRIAVVNGLRSDGTPGIEDYIENVLAKIGLGEVDGFGELVPGTEKFDLMTAQQGLQMLDDLNAMSKYHIIFMPCLGPGRQFIDGQTTRINNIRQWVAAGGKWYSTDYANDYLDVPFSDYQTFHGGIDGRPGDLELPYDTTATVLDPDLLAWLEALPPALKDVGGGAPTLMNLPQVEVLDSWSALDAIHPIIVQDEDGNDVDVGHYAWAEGTCPATSCSDATVVRPLTITGSYGCGRLMFSTYHTAEWINGTGLTPQELILLYIILEIGVCHDTTPPPPPPIG